MTMAKVKQIKWPPPPERGTRDREIGQEAGKLRAEYLEKGKGGSGAGQRRWVLKAAALDLLRTTGAPSSLVELFDVMLGGVSTRMLEMREPWLDLIVDIEARAYQFEDHREVTNAELVKAVMKAGLMSVSKDTAMRKVRGVRKKGWYSALIYQRCIYVVDNPETV